MNKETTILKTFKNYNSYELESEHKMKTNLSGYMSLELRNEQSDTKYSLNWIPNLLDMLWFLEQWCDRYGTDKVLNYARGRDVTIFDSLNWYLDANSEKIHPETPSEKIINDLFESVVKKLNKLKSGTQTFKDF